MTKNSIPTCPHVLTTAVLLIFQVTNHLESTATTKHFKKTTSLQSWLFTNIFRATRYIKLKRMGITEILRRIWLFSANKIKSYEYSSKQPTQLIVGLNSSLQHITVTQIGS